MNENDKFNEFLSKNPFKGVKYENVYLPPEKKNGNYKILYPSWISGEDKDRYIPTMTLTRNLNNLGYNSRIYYDIVVLGLTRIEDRPKCPVTGEYLDFISLTHGYKKFKNSKAFAKSLGMDFPESIERNRKLSNSQKGNKHSLGTKRTPEQRARMSRAQKGHGCTEIARKHMSDAHKGKPGSRTGIPHSKETREKLSINAVNRMINNPEWFEKFICSGIKNTHKGYYKSDKYLGNPKTGKWFFFASEFELFILEYCDSNNDIILVDKPHYINYEFEGKSRYYYPDIYIEFSTGEKCIVELKPSYRTVYPKNIAKRDAAIKYCNENNLMYSIITENEIELIKRGELSLLEVIKLGVKY